MTKPKFEVPRKDRGARGHNMYIRLSPKEEEKIRAMAVGTGQTMQEVIRRAVIFALEHMEL